MKLIAHPVVSVFPAVLEPGGIRFRLDRRWQWGWTIVRDTEKIEISSSAVKPRELRWKSGCDGGIVREFACRCCQFANGNQPVALAFRIPAIGCPTRSMSECQAKRGALEWTKNICAFGWGIG